MSNTLRSWTQDELATVRAIATQDSLARDFDWLHFDGLELLHSDPFFDFATRVLAERDGVPAGFGFAFVFGAAGGHPWGFLRAGVLEGHRRHGIGSRLLAEIESRVRASGVRLAELCFAAWEPCPEVHAFAERHGYSEVRRYWRMARTRDGAHAPEWPDGVSVRPFDGSEAALNDWNDIYNDSFSGHYHYFTSTVEDSRRIAASPRFEPTGLLLAYRDRRCVGFCRNQMHADRGEVEMLGVTEAERGIGLGRALLRWGVSWIAERRPPRITLMVDGDNEGALALYRAEGFEVERSRTMFGKPF